MEKPKILCERLPSGRTLIRFNELHELFWYDEYENNPTGISIRRNVGDDKTDPYDVRKYKDERSVMTSRKNDIIKKARKELTVDRDFLKLVYKAKSDKRGFEMSKFGGILSMPHYSRGEDKMFKKSKIGEKKITLNMAFQVGTMCGGDYVGSFVAIMKTILMAQALNISLNIDMFDSDRGGVAGGGYVVCNVAKSSSKLNLKSILTCSHEKFFSYSLFNGYSAAGGTNGYIDGYLSQSEIVRDLGQYYDIIGGNMLRGGQASHNSSESAMMSKILKIAWK